MKRKLLLSLMVIVSLSFITGCGNSTTKDSEKSNSNSNEKVESKEQYDEFKLYDKTFQLNKDVQLQKMSFKTDKDKLIYRTSGDKAAYVTYEDDSNPSDIIVDYGITVVNCAMRYFEGKNIDTVMSQAPYKRTTKKVGDIEYQYFEYTDNGIKGYCYSYEYGGSTYTITFEAKIDINSFVDAFMKNVSFK